MLSIVRFGFVDARLLMSSMSLKHLKALQNELTIPNRIGILGTRVAVAFCRPTRILTHVLAIVPAVIESFHNACCHLNANSVDWTAQQVWNFA